jgi:hypothetical protein
MTRFTIGLFAAIFLIGSTSAQDKPEAIVKKAIEAHGGEAALKKYPAGTSTITGTVVEPKLPFTGSMAFSVPGKVRIEMVFEIAAQKAKTVQVINGDKVSQTENGMPTKLSEAVADELRESAKIQEVSLLYPLLDARKYTLTAEKDATFDGKMCEVIGVKAKDLKETALAFDKKTGLLTAMSRKGLNPAQRAVDEVTTFSDYKPISGLKVPMKSKVAHDDKPFLEITVTEYKPLEKIDDDQFTVK